MSSKVASHTGAMNEHCTSLIELVVVNLYPFEATVKKPGVTRQDAIENIDIDGPSMVRSAAKNHRFVGIVTDPADYARVVEEMQNNGGGLSDAEVAAACDKDGAAMVFAGARHFRH